MVRQNHEDEKNSSEFFDVRVVHQDYEDKKSASALFEFEVVRKMNEGWPEASLHLFGVL
jgi:hypothetical protein